MTWEIVTSSGPKPSELDTISSKVYNYIRKDFEQIEVVYDGIKTYEWQYKECKVLKEDWDIFVQVMDNTSDIAMIEDALCELSKEG